VGGVTIVKLRKIVALGIVPLVVVACATTVPSTSPSPVSTRQPTSAFASVKPAASAASVLRPPPSASGVVPTIAPTSAPRPTALADTSGVATRIVIAALKIDLPIVTLPASGIHYCDVALRWPHPHFVEPGQPGAVYLLAHARAGMFLPLLAASMVSGGRSLLGLKVQVYTSADWRFTYTVSQVRRHVSTSLARLTAPLAATHPELWLQTSEGATTASPFLQIVASYASATPADHAAAHPTPRPTICN